MLKIKKSLNKVRDRVFKNVHSNNLIYNMCWEDPRCDRELLGFDQQSEVVMITSAGCNALDYLLDDPAAVHTIDMNPRQNAVLDLKKTLFQHGDYEHLWKFFGEGQYDEAPKYYEQQLKAKLPAYASEIWDKKLSYFTNKGLKKSFYFRGTSGSFAWLFNQYMRSRPKVYKGTLDLLEAKTLEEQTKLYNAVESKIITFLVRWLMNRHLTLTLLGVPRAQRQLIMDKYDDGVAGFAQECLRQVFTQIPIHDNYFWRAYITGKYTPECSPNYLKAENFDTLSQRVDRIHLYTTTISDFLKKNPKPYSHYILLDHQDWLAANNVPALEEEWDLILKNSRPGTKILLRSAAPEVTFIPEFAKKRLVFEQEVTQRTHKIDRVGTYASVYMGIVQ
ncbi:DUF3419 family protein [Eisenibacter elegans]|jgi:S-adenosylmethionine-diacylglycerol 3-amino-3-carboxypropyl transferase|uniref:DUF3419 family protein n=1 Tax=Eisenibacter elegans TaxID=997 RepID=UPI0004273F96|nr:BtaA family protein [Eisenibacter elegans]